MTIYNGELIRITATASDFDQTSITPDEIDSMTITIVDSDLVELVSAATMTYELEEELWFYLWDTSDDGAVTPAAIPAGTYRAKVVLLDLDDHESWEIKRIRLANNPF